MAQHPHRATITPSSTPSADSVNTAPWKSGSAGRVETAEHHPQHRSGPASKTHSCSLGRNGW